VKCDADGCTEYVPEGFYGPYTSFLCCSGACWQKRRAKRHDEVLCACGCGETVTHRVREYASGRAYVSLEHTVKHERELFFNEAFGMFRPIIDEYFSGFAAMHFRAPGTVRSSLARFFRY
jgi:hypothetical protein